MPGRGGRPHRRAAQANHGKCLRTAGAPRCRRRHRPQLGRTLVNNDQTIQAYNDNAEAYIDSMSPDIQGDVKTWIDRALKLLPKGSEIIELGSGAGREADYIETRGYKVIRTEAAPRFVE